MTDTIKELFSGVDATIIGDENLSVSRIAYNTKDVSYGDVFFCIVGLTVDGHSFAQQAIDKGASAIVVEREVYINDTGLTIIVVKDTRKCMALVASRLAGCPTENLDVVGITGTNGKTTTTYLVDHICRSNALKTGVIGTIGASINGEIIPTSHTTPESAVLQDIFAQMVSEGVTNVAMEVSSHALDLDRCWGVNFAVTAFTNLTQDHLDYHKTLEEYFEAKAKLFGSEYPAARAICIDNKYGKILAERCTATGDDVLTFGFSVDANISVRNVEYCVSGTTLELLYHGDVLKLQYPLVGKFNVENVLCALTVGLQLGFSAASIIEALSCIPQVPGRLQRVELENCDERHAIPSVYVDYAHTPDALANAISSLRGISSERLIVVFGCGGNRDRGKRPLMGRAALAADYVVVTSDNPRDEEPAEIIADIVCGMNLDKNGDVVDVVEDRAQAISHAIQIANAHDVILIAGKGHESYQIVKGETLDFDDRLVAASNLTLLADSQ